MTRVRWVACSVLFSSLACSDGDSPGDLSTNEVQDIPAGSARGSSASGRYDIDAYTTACEGRCGGAAGAFTFTICDVGDRDERTVDVQQDDGSLRIDGDESLFVSRFEGGIDGDGAFEVGGYGTEAGGSVEATGRLSGRVDGDSVEGLLELWIRGRWDGQPIDCRANYEVEGARIDDGPDDDD